VVSLEHRLTLLGRAPRRPGGPPTAEAAAAARARAEATLAATAATPRFTLEPVLTIGGWGLKGRGNAANSDTGDAASAGGRVQGPRFSGRGCRYYARLLINGKVVGTSQLVTMQEDFTVDFHDVFRWVGWWLCVGYAVSASPSIVLL